MPVLDLNGIFLAKELKEIHCLEPFFFHLIELLFSLANCRFDVLQVKDFWELLSANFLTENEFIST